MTDSSNEVNTFGSGMYKCRKLVEQGWNNYLENKYNTDNVLAYHWKDKSKDENGIFNFSKLIRITTASTNIKVIITYIIIVIFLGMLGSGLFEFVKWVFNR